MKKLFITAVFAAMLHIFTSVNAQVAIGKTTITNSSVLLEFASGNKGLILPTVSTIPTNNGGTFIFNSASKSVQVWEQRENGGTGGWLNLTDINAGALHSFGNSGGDKNITAGVIIGSTVSNKTGILVLESTSRALVLPIVQDPHLTMPGSVAGTMVFDSTSSTLAVYDGIKWNYWK